MNIHRRPVALMGIAAFGSVRSAIARILYDSVQDLCPRDREARRGMHSAGLYEAPCQPVCLNRRELRQPKASEML